MNTSINYSDNPTKICFYRSALRAWEDIYSPNLIKYTITEQSMTTYLLPKARNTVTGQTVKTQDLTGTRFALNQRRLAQDMADQTAAKLSARTGVLWEGFLVEYIPSVRA